MKRLVLAAALAAGSLVLPVAASAAVKQIIVNEGSETVRAPGGAFLRSQQATSATVGFLCSGGAQAGVSLFSTSMASQGGTSITADAGGGVSTTFPLPFGAYDRASATTASVKLGSLPGNGGTLSINGGAAQAYSGTAYSTPFPVSIGGGAVVIASTVGSVPFQASLLAPQFSIDASATLKQAKKAKKRRSLAVAFTAKMAGRLNVRVLDTKSKTRSNVTIAFAVAGKKATLTVLTKTWAKGRYTVVLQFTDASGTPGPVVLQPLRIT